MSFIIAGTFVTGLYWLIFLAVFLSARRSLKILPKRRPSGVGMDWPSVSVIVAVRNEELNLPGLLQHLSQQQYMGNRAEFIVTDDHSEDGTAEIAENFLRTHPEMPLRFIRAAGSDQTGKKAALERGLRQSSGSIILTTDGDTVLRPGWILSMVDLLADAKVKMVLGPVFFHPGGNLLQKLLATEFLGIMGATCGFAGLGRPVMGNGANLAFRREVFNEAGGYSANIRFSSGDDQFLMMEVRMRFGRFSVDFCPAPEAIVTTEAPATWRALFSQRLRWLSKSRGYRDKWVIAAGLITALPILAIVTATLTGLVSGDLYLLMISQVWMLIKMAADYLLVNGMARFSGSRQNLWYFILAQYLHLLYAPAAGVASLFFRGRWKGRKLE
jgi:cellulose synthase/poly-beta-1,6-N-acetylglucosamine synthase-like glycosyltransferase